jgi:hypothetical protein
LLWLPFLLCPASFVLLTPLVFLLPLLLVTTAVLDETVFPFELAGTLALVSIMPSRAGLPLVVALEFAALRLAFVFVVELSPPQPMAKLAADKATASAKVRRIKFLPVSPPSSESGRM